mgnify:CR=1 FL=1|tara:strand:- start:3272 stop:3949 length:678 start_codon:yes stop_codon:yes gene_type:complete
MRKISKKVLFMGRSEDKYSLTMIKFLKKKFKFLSIYLSKNSKDRPSKKIQNWKGDIIICFRSYYILKQNFINKAKICAINFHPGPPRYRGIGCVNFAIEKGEAYYGATAHLIDKKVDSGKILDCKFFKILKNSSIDQILNKTYKFQLKQLKNLINKMIKNNFDINSFKTKNKWSSKLYLRKELNLLYKIDKNIKKKDLKKRIAATNTKNFKPYILLHGYKFTLDL